MRSRAGRRTGDEGFTITELIIVVAVISVVAAVALSQVRWGQRDTETWADAISRTISAARLRGVSGRQWYRVDITANPSSGVSQITTWFTAPSTPPAGNDCAASSGWTQDLSLSRTAPREALTWRAVTSPSTPTAPETVNLKICFRPDFTLAACVGSGTCTPATASLNAYIYVGAPTGLKGWTYRIAMEGVGVVRVTNPW